MISNEQLGVKERTRLYWFRYEEKKVGMDSPHTYKACDKYNKTDPDKETLWKGKVTS